jgi:hypothetical protein
LGHRTLHRFFIGPSCDDAISILYRFEMLLYAIKIMSYYL